MLGTRAVLGEAFEVFGRAVTFVFGELVLRVPPIEFDHVGVAGNLSED